LKEIPQEKTEANKAAAAAESTQSQKTNNSRKKKKDNAPEQAAAVLTPSKGEKGDRSKEGKGSKKDGRSHSQGKGEHQGKGPAQKADGSSRDPSTLHCYWSHHPKGCQCTKCLFKHDKKISAKDKAELMAIGLDKRSTSAPNKPTSTAEPRVRTKVCFEYQKSGTCVKGADCAYEHVIVNDSKKTPGPKTALRDVSIVTPVISIFEDREEDSYVAAMEDLRRRVSFDEVKIIRGAKKSYDKDVKRHLIQPFPLNEKISRIHARIAIL